MSDELARSLREEGHDDVAEVLERKLLAKQLRQADRADLADQLEGPGAAQDANAALLAEIKGRLDNTWNAGSTPLFEEG